MNTSQHGIDPITGIRSVNGRHWLDNWVVSYEDIIHDDISFFRNLLKRNPRLIFYVSSDCLFYLFALFSEEISQGLQDWECVFSMSKEWFVTNYTRVPVMKQHFERRPGLWFYIFRYDQKKINPRTGDIGKDLTDAWTIMDFWGLPHNTVKKVGNEYKILDV